MHTTISISIYEPIYMSNYSLNVVIGICKMIIICMHCDNNDDCGTPLI